MAGGSAGAGAESHTITTPQTVLLSLEHEYMPQSWCRTFSCQENLHKMSRRLGQTKGSKMKDSTLKKHLAALVSHRQTVPTKGALTIKH